MGKMFHADYSFLHNKQMNVFESEVEDMIVAPFWWKQRFYILIELPLFSLVALGR